MFSLFIDRTKISALVTNLRISPRAEFVSERYSQSIHQNVTLIETLSFRGYFCEHHWKSITRDLL